MADLAFVALTVAVFALLAAIAKGIEKLVSAENIAGLVIAAALVVYLVVALIWPERF